MSRRKRFIVSLERIYAVEILAENKEFAKKLVEAFVGDPCDVSEKYDRKDHNFEIIKIKLIDNNASEVLNY